MGNRCHPGYAARDLTSLATAQWTWERQSYTQLHLTSSLGTSQAVMCQREQKLPKLQDEKPATVHDCCKDIIDTGIQLHCVGGYIQITKVYYYLLNVLLQIGWAYLLGVGGGFP